MFGFRNQSPSKGSPLSRLHMSSLLRNASPAQRAHSPQTNVQTDVTEQQETWRSLTFLQVLVLIRFILY